MTFILLSKGKKSQVDQADAEWLGQWKWTFMDNGRGGYAYRKEGKRSVLMHREILKAPKKFWVDHRDGNGLDNQRANLRLCTPRQSAWNCKRKRDTTSQHKGVHWCNTSQRWVAKIRTPSGRQTLGYFRDEEEAAQAYKQAALALHGEFAYELE